jgi:ESCRT-I complex subunit TSG101
MSVHEKAVNEIVSRTQYKYKDLTKRDVAGALGFFKELNPSIEKYVYPDGQYKDLVSLSGTIPVNFKNNRYNIPIQMYLSDMHPYTPPIVYVRPTPDMNINVTDTVQSDGRIRIPYLSEWNFPQSDLYVLLNMLTIKFSEETPLYARTRSNSQVQQQQLQQQPPPLPSTVKYNNPPGMPYQQPSGSTTMPYPTYMQPVPTYPSSGGPGSSALPYPTASSTGLPYPASNSPYYPMPIIQPPTLAGSSGNSGSGNNLNQRNGPLPPIRPPGNMQPLNSSSSSSSYADDTIKPEFYKLSLISAVQDKVRMRMTELTEEKRAEIDSLKKISQDLELGERRLNNLIGDTNDEISNIKRLCGEIKKRCATMNEQMSRMQLREKANVEDAIVTPAPLYRQLFQLFTEELAIQDLLFYLSEGLTHKTISLDTYLKQVRLLSRKQFTLRATMQKAREKAGLSA